MLRKIIKKNKLGISEMLSYVILISIAIALSVAVFVWMQSESNFNPPLDCQDGTSVIIENSSCSGNLLTLSLKNNGLFNISGVLVSVGNDSARNPSEYFQPNNAAVGSGLGNTAGYFFFSSELAPGDSTNAIFENLVNTTTIRIIQIQPFIYSNKQRVFCTQAIIKQQIPDCFVTKI